MLDGVDAWKLGDLAAWGLGGLEAWRLGGLLIAPWGACGLLGAILEACWGPLGRLLRASWSLLGASWRFLGPLRSFSGLRRVSLEPSWGFLNVSQKIWEPFGTVLGSLLIAFWGFVRVTWGHFEPS